ncbi:MAG: FlgO family outer membrane protein [Pseudomonadota bacterium]
MPIKLFRVFVFALVALCLPTFAKANHIKPKIAVLDFELCGDKFTTDELGSMVAEWFVTSLVKDGRFDVIERALLKKILEEQKLGTTGALDDNSVSQIGKVLGVKIIITGSVVNLGKILEVNSRIISVEDGTIIAAENIKCASTADLQRIVEELTGKIVKNFPLTGFVVKKDKAAVLIDLGKGAGVHPGMEFIVFKEGKTISHPKTGEILDVERIDTGRIKISEINGNVAEAVILNEEEGGIEYGQLVKSVQSKKIAAPRPSVQANISSKSTGGQGAQMVDSPIFDESEKQKLAEKPSESKGSSHNKTKSLDRFQTRTPLEPKKQMIASTSGCQELLRSWQLGDSSVMQRYLKECAQ